MADHVDVAIVGAGISGISAAYRLQTRCPDKKYAILEARDALGGTWDLFRYPGIRSDADLFQFGFPFEPWTSEKSIADGDTILEYVHGTAAKYGIDRHIRFDSKITRASWSSEDAQWTLEATHADGTTTETTASFVYLCSGYYRYEAGHEPVIPGIESFDGVRVHPQKWPADLDYDDKNVVVIGSGATAITLIPSLAKRAAQVTMLQRSPGYVMAMPDKDAIADVFRKFLPPTVAHGAARWKNVLIALAVFNLFRSRPAMARNALIGKVSKLLPEGYAIDPHFTPKYNVFDQRMLLVPNGDMFKAIASGRAAVATGEIETVLPDGIQLKSGEVLPADIIVTATGLHLQFAGAIKFAVDGEDIELKDRIAYKAIMLDGVPNLAFCFGYSNAPWTLRADLAARYVSRLIEHMDRNRYIVSVPRLKEVPTELRPLLALESGYVKRSADVLPKQGSSGPWFLRQNYVVDFVATKFGDITDSMEFSTTPIKVSS